MVELTPGDVDGQIRALMSEKYVAPDYLRLFQEVFNVQYQAERKLSSEKLYPPISKEQADKRIGQGLPLIDPDRFRFGESELYELLQKIGSILAKYGAGGNSAAERLLEAQESGQVSLEELARKALADDVEYFRQVSGEIGEGKEEVLLLVTILVAPFVRACAISLRQGVNWDSMQAKRCPICGGAPLMAKLREGDGKRILECSLCNTQWAFKRLRCPFCGNEDQDGLGFFFTEKEGAYRLDKCDKCRRYIKTVDERRKAEGKLRALAVEDVATLYLDMLAEEEGYQSIKEPQWQEVNG